MSSTSGESGERSGSKDRSRPEHTSLRGLDLPHPTSPADTTHTEMIDMRPANDARTQAIPMPPQSGGPPRDAARTETIRQRAPGPLGQQDVPASPDPAAPTESLHQLSFGQQGSSGGQQPLSLSAEIARYAPAGQTDPTATQARTNPIPQHAVSPSRPRPSGGKSGTDAPPPQPVGIGRPHGGPTSPIPRQPGNRSAPQPEQAWQLGVPDPSASHRDSPSQSDPQRRSDVPPDPDTAGRPASSRPPVHPAPTGPADTDSKHADRPLSARERKRWLLAGIGAAAVVVLGIGATLLMTGGGSDGTKSTVSALTSGSAAPSPAAAAATTAPARVANLAPLIPGYQAIQVPDRGAAFDVPRQWQVDPTGTTTWGTAPNTVEIAGLVQDGKGYCPNYIRTNTFLTMSPQSNPAAATVDIGTRLAKIGWATSTGTTPGKAEPLTSLDGQLHGWFAETDGTFKPPAAGCAKTYAVYTFAFPGENGSFVMTIAADTGVDKSVDKATAQRILASIRPLTGK